MIPAITLQGICHHEVINRWPGFVRQTVAWWCLVWVAVQTDVLRLLGSLSRLEISLLVQQEALNFHDFPEVDYSLELLITELLFANLPHWPFAPKPLQSLRPRSFHCFSCRCQVVIDPRISIDFISCAVCNPFPSLLGFGQQSLPLRPSLLQLWLLADFRLSHRQVFADIVNTLQERRAKWCTICAIESDWIRLNQIESVMCRAFSQVLYRVQRERHRPTTSFVNLQSLQ